MTLDKVLGIIFAILIVAGIMVVAIGDRPSSDALSGDRESTSTTPSSTMPAPPPDAPLPPPEALTDVLYKLADTSVPGDQKIDLVDGATIDDAATFDKFGKALQDSGYTPVDFTAENIAWASNPLGHVTSDVTVHSENMPSGFTFPMEFKPTPAGGWQLSRTTAGILLTFGQNPATPTPTG